MQKIIQTMLVRSVVRDLCEPYHDDLVHVSVANKESIKEKLLEYFDIDMDYKDEFSPYGGTSTCGARAEGREGPTNTNDGADEANASLFNFATISPDMTFTQIQVLSPAPRTYDPHFSSMSPPVCDDICDLKELE